MKKALLSYLFLFLCFLVLCEPWYYILDVVMRTNGIGLMGRGEGRGGRGEGDLVMIKGRYDTIFLTALHVQAP